MRIIHSISDKLKSYENFNVYEKIYHEKINVTIDNICDLIMRTLSLVHDNYEIKGYAKFFNDFKITYNTNYNTDLNAPIDNIHDDENVGVIDELKLAIESYFEFKNSNKTEDLRLNNNQYFLSTYCKKNMIDDLNDIQS